MAAETAPDPYPEHTKQSKILDRSQTCGEFLDWLSEQGLTLCVSVDSYDHPYVPAHRGAQQLLADFFGIDLDKIEAEKRAMLDALRAMNP